VKPAEIGRGAGMLLFTSCAKSTAPSLIHRSARNDQMRPASPRLRLPWHRAGCLMRFESQMGLNEP
jgi:hypothetical protein